MLLPNSVLQNRYRIVRHLGEGGMGTVYEVLDLRLSSIVALKETLVEMETYRRAFEREASLLANLRHPSLPIVTDHFTEGQGQYLVMQFVEGDDLGEMLVKRGRPFPLQDALRWADGLLDALEYLHGHAPPIIHRDIKPANLKLTTRGQIILLDFGLAKGIAGQMSTLSTSRSVLGYTPVYAPLEQIHGAGTDPRSDLYALGATLYHLITNVVPVDAPSRFLAIEEERPDPLRAASELNTEVPFAIADVIARAMALSRKDRFQSAAEMRRALREAGRSLSAAKSEDSIPETILSQTVLSADESNRTVSSSEVKPASQSESAPSVDEARTSSPVAQTWPVATIATTPEPDLSPFEQHPVQARQAGISAARPTATARKNSRRWLIAAGALLSLIMLGGILFALNHYFRGDGDGDSTKALDPAERGRILDRTAQPERTLALTRENTNGDAAREYPSDTGLAHLLGSERGEPGLDRALFNAKTGVGAGKDVRLTIDRELQLEAVAQLKKTGKHGAVVILNPQTGEVLAMYSDPSYSLKEIKDDETWKRLDANKQDGALVNRVLDSYYIPGSTFKTMTMIAAHLAGEQGSEFNCSGSGYVAMPGAKPILDDGGASEVHGRIGMGTAYEVACNQYFAQLAVKLGPDRMQRAARLLGVGTYETTEGAFKGLRRPEIWNASTEAVKSAIAPREATMVIGPFGTGFTRFDLALEGFGQGYAGQMTPFQMALFASAIANTNGDLMKPMIEWGRPPEVYNHIVSPQHASAMRAIMGLVTGGTNGTARGVFAPVKAAGINTGGKTGTAQKDVPVYDPKTGEPKTVKKYERDAKGNIIREYDSVVVSPEPRLDGWFLCIAPLERPVIAIAVVIEGGGYGSRSAAPVAADLILKAKELGYFGKP